MVPFQGGIYTHHITNFNVSFLANREGASDGNGGQEAYGHNPDDYILPQKYTVLTEDDYNHGSH